MLRLTRTRVLILTVATVALSLAMPAGISLAGTPRLRFRSVSLAGSSGFSEPRVTVAPHGLWYLATNAKDGTMVVYRSHGGSSWSLTKATPPDQTAPSTDVDVVSTRTGRVVASELDFGGINFRTAFSDDGGASWSPSQGTTYADTDRQWMADRKSVV